MNKLTLSQLSKKNLDKIQQRAVKGGCDGSIGLDGCICCDCINNNQDVKVLTKDTMIKIGN